MSNQEQSQKQKCTYCDGTGLNKVELQDLNKNSQLEYHPIECQHCKGSGKEPQIRTNQ